MRTLQRADTPNLHALRVVCARPEQTLTGDILGSFASRLRPPSPHSRANATSNESACVNSHLRLLQERAVCSMHLGHQQMHRSQPRERTKCGIAPSEVALTASLRQDRHLIQRAVTAAHDRQSSHNVVRVADSTPNDRHVRVRQWPRQRATAGAHRR